MTRVNLPSETPHLCCEEKAALARANTKLRRGSSDLTAYERLILDYDEIMTARVLDEDIEEDDL